MTILEIEYVACRIASIGSLIAFVIAGLLSMALPAFLFALLFIGATAEWIWLESIGVNKNAKV